MFKHILIPTDGSQLSDSAALNAVQLAKSISARVTAVTVSTPFHVFTSDYVMLSDTEDVYKEDCKRRGAKNLDVVRKAAESAGVVFDGIHVFHEHPYAAIIDAANEKGCDVICMASHGRKGTIALVVGSETMKVLTTRRSQSSFGARHRVHKVVPAAHVVRRPHCRHGMWVGHQQEVTSEIAAS